MDFAHGGELSVALPDIVLELDGNHVFEIYLGVEGCLIVITPPYLDHKCWLLCRTLDGSISNGDTFIL